MDRSQIERRDFSAARRGYDPKEVDDHLREVADQVESLKRGTPGSAGLASTAAEQVRGIVDAAERSAADIHQQAEDEARRVGQDAEAHARDVREKADTDAAEHVQRVRGATDLLLERASAAESEVEGLLDSLRTEAGSLVDNIRTKAESVRSELEQIHAGLPGLRPASGGPDVAAAPAAEVDVAGEAEEELPAEEAPDEFATVEEEEAVEAPSDEAAVGAEEVKESGQQAIAGSEGARLIALNMALNGTPREETAQYLSENFDLDDQDAVLDEVYSRVGG
jgi:DivIVA domain-containing protein